MNVKIDSEHPKRPVRTWVVVAFAATAVVAAVSYGAFKVPNEASFATPAGAAALTKSTAIPVEGMACVSCVARVKSALKNTRGVTEVHVSLESREAEIRYEPTQISEESLANLINEIGYKAGTPRPKEEVQ